MSGNMDAVRALQQKQAEAKAAKSGAKYSAQQGTAQGAGASATDKQAAHDELMQMCAEVSLLDLARQDTGETGDNTGDEWRFRACPVCGHNNDFAVFESTNTWVCYSADTPAPQNSNGRAGGNALDYLRWARHGGDNTAAIAELREITGHPFEPKGKGTAQGDQSGDGNPQDVSGYILPRWEHVQVLDPPKRKPVLIPGILRRGHVAVVVSKGKAGKTCTVMELTIATATNGEWFGRSIENGGKCLFLDPEVDNPSAHVRFEQLCERMGADKQTVYNRVLKWPLRGTIATIEQVEQDIRRGVETGDLADLALVVVDSASIFIEDDENSSVSVRKFAAHLMRIAAITGASVVAVAHTGKAKDGDRNAADRARGSSVWLDFPDALISLTETFPPSGEPKDYLGEGRYGCMLEVGGLREFGRFEPVRSIFEYPAHIPDADNITDGWKADSSARNGGKATGEGNKAKSAERAAKCVTALLAEFVARGTAEGIPATEAAEVVSAAIGETVKAQTLKDYIEKADALQVEQISKQRWQVAPKRKPPEPPPTLDL